MTGRGRLTVAGAVLMVSTVTAHAQVAVEKAETVMSMSLVGGDRMSIFRTAPHLKAMVADLRRAQAEAEIRCF
jgi:hypothetical protein